jgi:hypothetical protein
VRISTNAVLIPHHGVPGWGREEIRTFWWLEGASGATATMFTIAIDGTRWRLRCRFGLQPLFSASPTMKSTRVACSWWRKAVGAGGARLYIPPTCASNEASSVGLIIAAGNQSNCVASRE